MDVQCVSSVLCPEHVHIWKRERKDHTTLSGKWVPKFLPFLMFSILVLRFSKASPSHSVFVSVCVCVCVVHIDMRVCKVKVSCIYHQCSTSSHACISVLCCRWCIVCCDTVWLYPQAYSFFCTCDIFSNLHWMLHIHLSFLHFACGITRKVGRIRSDQRREL